MCGYVWFRWPCCARMRVSTCCLDWRRDRCPTRTSFCSATIRSFHGTVRVTTPGSAESSLASSMRSSNPSATSNWTMQSLPASQPSSSSIQVSPSSWSSPEMGRVDHNGSQEINSKMMNSSPSEYYLRLLGKDDKPHQIQINKKLKWEMFNV